MPELVIRALEEGAVDAVDGLGTTNCEAGAQRDGVLLRDADVDELLACCGATIGREAHHVRRGGRDGNKLLVRGHALE